jgi:hypothetical protein
VPGVLPGDEQSRFLVRWPADLSQPAVGLYEGAARDAQRVAPQCRHDARRGSASRCFFAVLACGFFAGEQSGFAGLGFFLFLGDGGFLGVLLFAGFLERPGRRQVATFDGLLRLFCRWSPPADRSA